MKEIQAEPVTKLTLEEIEAVAGGDMCEDGQVDPWDTVCSDSGDWWRCTAANDGCGNLPDGEN